VPGGESEAVLVLLECNGGSEQGVDKGLQCNSLAAQAKFLVPSGSPRPVLSAMEDPIKVSSGIV
jgi:hypothetical protein